MAKSDTIKIQKGQEIIELTGADKEAFIADRAETQKQMDLAELERKSHLELKVSAYKKLGLTTEEIGAIL